MASWRFFNINTDGPTLGSQFEPSVAEFVVKKLYLPEERVTVINWLSWLSYVKRKRLVSIEFVFQ